MVRLINVLNVEKKGHFIKDCKIKENDCYKNNSYKKWSKEEEKKLLQMIRSKSITEIADELERTNGAIKSRITKIIKKMYEEDFISITEIMCITGYGRTEIKDIIDDKYDFKENYVKKKYSKKVKTNNYYNDIEVINNYDPSKIDYDYDLFYEDNNMKKYDLNDDDIFFKKHVDDNSFKIEKRNSDLSDINENYQYNPINSSKKEIDNTYNMYNAVCNTLYNIFTYNPFQQ